MWCRNQLVFKPLFASGLKAYIIYGHWIGALTYYFIGFFVSVGRMFFVTEVCRRWVRRGWHEWSHTASRKELFSYGQYYLFYRFIPKTFINFFPKERKLGIRILLIYNIGVPIINGRSCYKGIMFLNLTAFEISLSQILMFLIKFHFI